jgi:PAS domain S-box-containing protein
MLNLKRNIILNILAAAAVPVCIFIFVTVSYNIEVKKQLVFEKCLTALKISADSFESYLNERVNEITLMASTPVVKSMDWDKIKPFLIQEQERSGYLYDNFFIGLPESEHGYFYSTKYGNPFKKGLVSIDDSSPEAELLSLENDDFWKSTVADNGDRRNIYISDLEKPVFSDTRYVITAVTILDDRGNTLGMLGGSIEWYFLQNDLEENLANVVENIPGTQAILINDYGRIIYKSGEMIMLDNSLEQRGLSADLFPLLGKITENSVGSEVINTSDGKFIVFYDHISNAGYYILLKVPYETAFSMKNEILTRVIPSIAVIIFCTIAVALLFYKRLEHKLVRFGKLFAADSESVEKNIDQIREEPEFEALGAALSKIIKTSEEYKYISEIVTEGINGTEFWIDGSGKIRFMSSGVMGLTGYFKDEFINNAALLDSLPVEEDNEKWFSLKLAYSEAGVSDRIRIRKKTGKVIWTECHIKEVRNKGGLPDGIRGSIIDINYLVTSERMFNEHEQLFRKVFIKNSAVMVLVDPVNGIIHDVNTAAENFYLTKKENLINKSIMSYIKDSRHGMSFSLDRFINEDTVTQVLPDGSVKETEIHTTLLKFKDQVQLFLIVYDITNKIELQKKITESEELFRNLAENVPVGILLFHDKSVYLNPTACEITGFSQEELEKSSLWELVSVEQQSHVKNSYFKVMESAHATKKLQDTRIVCKSGMHKNIFMTISNISYHGKAAALVTVVDITEIKEIQHQLERKVAAEVEKQRQQEIVMMSQARLAAMGEMIGSIAHQWRQPLNTIGLYIQDIEDAFEHEEVSAAYIRDTVSKSMMQIGMLSKTIDDFSRYYKPIDKKTAFSALTAAVEAFKTLRSRLLSENTDLTIITSGEEDKTYDKLTPNTEIEDDEFIIQGYHSDFKQVIITVIKNSADSIMDKKSSAPAGFRGKISITIIKTRDSVILKIADNGSGVKVENMEKVFDPYFSTKGQGKGTGLGLYMSKIVIEKNMNGKISIENTDEGALVTITVERS